MDLGLGQNGYAGVGDSAEVSADSALPQTLTPALSQRERGTSTLTPDPLEMIAEGNMSVADIARASGVSILELAAHVCTAQNLETLARVKQLHATQREMLLGKLKREALMRLRELTAEVGAMNANEVRACEVMRKACVDILRFGNGSTRSERGSPGPGESGPGSRSHHREPLTPATEAEVLEALERWGQEENQYEPRARASGSVKRPPSQAPLESRLPNDPSPHNGPGARASGSYLESQSPADSPPPPESQSPPESESPPPPEVPPELMDTRTGGMPMPLALRRMPNRSPNSDKRILFDDAHPP